MASSDVSSIRWSDYFLKSGNDFQSFWKNYLQNETRDILCVLGMGFDSRMCMGYEALLNAGGSGKRDCRLAEFNEGPSSMSHRYSQLVEANLKKLDQLIPSGSRKETKEISMWSADHRRITSRSAAGFFEDLSDFIGYSDVVIDISAVPRAVYFSLIGKALYLLDTCANEKAAGKWPNLHVLVSENPSLDSKIKDAGIDEDANYLHGFTGTLESETFAILPKIWIPVLGENQEQQLSLISNKISPDEVCPILPMPSVNPRRADNLLIEYRELLFDQLRIEPRNFIYVSEQNPFEVYRAIHLTVRRYKEALQDLGGCQVVISASSSKLLSIGALLAAYELRGESVGVINVDTQGYQIEGDINADLESTVMSTLWLSGDCYSK